MVSLQEVCTYLPPFKYTDLTKVDYAFYQARALPDTNKDWGWVPYILPECTSLDNAFYRVAQIPQSDGVDTSEFPQLQTSDKLTNVQYCFYLAGIDSFVNKDGNKTYKPFTDTSAVTDFDYAFGTIGIDTPDSLEVDTSAAISLKGTFSGINFVTVPAFSTSNVKDWSSTFYACTTLELSLIHI